MPSSPLSAFFALFRRPTGRWNAYYPSLQIAVAVRRQTRTTPAVADAAGKGKDSFSFVFVLSFTVRLRRYLSMAPVFSLKSPMAERR